MALTGDADGPPLAPATDAAAVADRLLAPFGLDAGVLSERAAHLGFRRRGRISCGGATRLVEAADGWFALALARDEDLDMVPALLHLDRPDGDPWAAIERIARTRSVEEIVEQGALLGLAISVVDAEPGSIRIHGAPRSDADPNRPAPLVVDLSALWAGPLCTHLLGRWGARIVKIESRHRPDGARRGVASFHDLLNHGKASWSVDTTTSSGRERFRDLVMAADVVVSSSRQRALDQLGLDPDEFLGAGTDRIWVAITGHGWTSNRIAFGDDAAAAAGLVARGDDGAPRFAGDALADPLCGIHAAHRIRRLWGEGGRWFLDLPLTGVAAEFRPTGPTRAAEPGPAGWVIDGEPVVEPLARPADGPAAPLGADDGRFEDGQR